MREKRESMMHTGLAGYPVAHSLSPRLHNAVYRELGLDWEYGLYPCVDEAAFAELLAELRATDDWVGLNVTTPYKPQAYAASNLLTPFAQTATAVNTLTPAVVSGAPATLVGDNTDGRGLLASLARETGITPAGRSFVICGSGAVSRSVAAALLAQNAAHITILSRTATEVAQTSPVPEIPAPLPTCTSYAHAAEALATADVLIDATTLGMRPNDPAPVPTQLLRGDLVVIDTVYGHGESALVAAARALGAPVFDGLGMLVEQAALNIELWLAARGISKEVPRDLMYTVAHRCTSS